MSLLNIMPTVYVPRWILIHLSYKQKEAGPWRSEYPNPGVVDVRLMKHSLEEVTLCRAGESE